MARRTKIWVRTAVVVAIAGGGAGLLLSRGAAASSSTKYLTAAVTRGNVALTVQTTGIVEPQSTYDLAFGAGSGGSGGGAGGVGGGSSGSGGGARGPLVSTVDVKPGGIVKAGQVLAVESTTTLDQQLSVAEAVLAAAEAKQAAETPNPLPGTSAAVAPATNAAAVASAQQSVSAARAAVAATSISAPVAGVVIAVNVVPGEVAPTAPAVVMRSLSFVVQADVAETNLSDVSPGESAKISLPALTASIPGKVTAMPTQANPEPSNPAAAAAAPVTFPITLSLSGTVTGLIPGMSAQVTIVKSTRTGVLVIPTTAVHGSGRRTHVLLLVNNKPQRHDVVVGLMTPTTTQLLSGLTVGEKVITGIVNPSLSLTPGGHKGHGLGGGFKVGGKGKRG
ncbi:MAG: efflux RND transporter periplasmic adaptor subunit [Acidimicrobiales bacterium]